MKRLAIVAAVLIGMLLVFSSLQILNEWLAPLFLNSRIERLGEKGLPKILVRGSTIYCRMKADDFRFPLPPNSQAVHPIVSGGFDTVEGSVEARFEGRPRPTASEYEAFLSGKVQVGGNINVQSTPDGLLVKFSYFGDR